MLSPRYFVEANLYPDEEAVIQDALRHLLRLRPELKIQLAVYRYQKGEVSLAKAASLAGISWIQMKDVLTEQGIPLRLGPETIEEAKNEVESLRKEIQGNL
jgi:predicted HTH domain antitoxin